MAVQTIYLLGTQAVTPNFFGQTQLNGTAPTAANSAFGWGPAKTAVTTPYYRGRMGSNATGIDAAVASSYNAGTSGPTKGTNNTGAVGDSFVAGPFSGTFANTAWTFNCNMRAGTAGCIGHINMRFWRSSNADGSSATQITANTAGATITLSTSADQNSSITWSPGQLVLTNQYLFFQIEWQETTAGSANGDNVLFRIGTASITTADFVAAATGTLGLPQANQTISAAARSTITGPLNRAEVPDTFVGAGGPTVQGPLNRLEINDTIAATGTVFTPVTGTLARAEVPDTLAAAGTVATGGGPPPPWTPALLGADLLLWLDAADAATVHTAGIGIAQWDDKSGYARHVTQVTDASRPGYSFSPPFVVLNSTTFFNMVGSPTAYDLAWIGYGFQTDVRGLLLVAGSAYYGLITDASGQLGDYVGGFHGSGLTWPANVDGLIYTQLSSTANQQISFNGSGFASTGTTVPDVTPFYIGTSQPYPAGDLFEFILVTYNSPLDVKQKLEGYLAWKWGKVALLPSDHPYKLAAPTGEYGLHVIQQNQTIAATGTVPLPAAPLVAGSAVLLCHFDDASTFIDSSDFAQTLTPTGLVSLTAAQQKFGARSGFFGSDAAARIDTGQASLYQFGSAPFTIEAWCYFTVAPAVPLSTIASQWETIAGTGSANLGWTFFFNNGVLSFGWSTGGDASTFHQLQATSYTPPLNQWVHLAVDRDGSGVLRIYVNGSGQASVSAPAAFYNSPANCLIGNDQTLARACPGMYLDELRIVRGTAMYGGPFTPPTAPFSSPSSRNVAASWAGGTASASSTYSVEYSASNANSGNRNITKGGGWGQSPPSGGWNSVPSGHFPDWFQVDFNATYTINEIDIVNFKDDYTVDTGYPLSTDTFSSYGNTDLIVQYWDGSAFQTITHITGNNLVWNKIQFADVATGRIRITINDSADHLYSRLVEVEAWTSVGGTTVSGTLNVTEAPDTIAAAGGPRVGATLGLTEPLDTVASAGTVLVGGTLNRAEVPDTIVAAAGPVARGILSLPQAAQGLASTGTVLVGGTLNRAEVPDTIVAAGGPRASGALSVSQDAQTLAATGTVAVRGTLNAVQASHALSATGTALAGITATLNVVEVPDALTALGTVANPITIGPNDRVSEDRVHVRVIESDGTTHRVITTPAITASLTVTETADSLSANCFVGFQPIIGTLSVIQQPQALTAAGSVGYGPEEAIQSSPLIDLNYPGPYRVGNEVHFVVPGQITKAQFHRLAASTVTSRSLFLHRTTDGALVATSNASVGEAGTGWVQVTFPSPIPVAAGSNYTISYDVPDIFSYGASAPNVTNAAHATWVIGRYGDMGAGYPAGLVPDTNYSADLIWQPLLPVTATLNQSQANQTLAATAGPVVGGTLNVLQANQTIAAAGSPRVSATLSVAQANETLASGGLVIVGGALTVTQANNTLAAAGAVPVRGSLAVAQAANTIAAGGSVLSGISGTLNQPQAAQTLAAAGTVTGAVGTVNVLQANQTLAATGTVVVRGTLNLGQANQTVVATGGLVARGTLSISQADETLAAAAGVTVRGTLAVLEANDTIAATGSLVARGTLTQTQANQTIAATGTVFSVISGTLNQPQAAQALAASATVAIAGALNRTQADNALAAAGVSPIRGALAVTQAAQTLASVGRSPITGRLVVAQNDNAIAATGDAVISGTVTVIQEDEGLDATGIVGLVGIIAEPGPVPGVPPDRYQITDTPDRIVSGNGNGRTVIVSGGGTGNYRTVIATGNARTVIAPPLRRVS